VQASSPPSFGDVGLPRGRGQIALSLGGTYAPGVRLGFQIGLYEGAASVSRHFSWSLWEGPELIERDEVSVETLRSGERVTLGILLPRRAPASYQLRLQVASPDGSAKSFLWPVEVPEQRVEARLVAQPSRLRRGETFTATLHNDGPTEITAGEAFALERFADGDWEDVDPFDGENVGWLAIGYVVAPGGSKDFQVQVPRMTQPGRHRMIKRISAETARVRKKVAAEFDVSD
jgi:hypothetical protein